MFMHFTVQITSKENVDSPSFSEHKAFRLQVVTSNYLDIQSIILPWQTSKDMCKVLFQTDLIKTQKGKQEKGVQGIKTQEKMLTTKMIINMRRNYKLRLATQVSAIKFSVGASRSPCSQMNNNILTSYKWYDNSRHDFAKVMYMKR